MLKKRLSLFKMVIFFNIELIIFKILNDLI